MHVLVIGAAGMVGRKLVEALVAKGEINGKLVERLTLADVAGVAPPRDPAATVSLIESNKLVRVAIAGHSSIDLGTDFDIDQALRDVHAKLAATSACKRGPKPETAVRQIVGRAEAPQPTDAVIVVDAEKPSTAIVGVVGLLGYPTVIAVRDPVSRQLQVLPLRFCASYAEPVPRLASAIESPEQFQPVSETVPAELIIRASCGSPVRPAGNPRSAPVQRL